MKNKPSPYHIHSIRFLSLFDKRTIVIRLAYNFHSLPSSIVDYAEELENYYNCPVLVLKKDDKIEVIKESE
jgi:hypothetical protein